VEDFIVKHIEEDFKEITNLFALNSANAIVLKDYAALSGFVDNIKGDEHVSYAVILDENGDVLAHSQHELEGKALTDPVSLKAAAAHDLLIQAVDSNTIDVTAPLMIAGKKWGAVRIGFSLARIKMMAAKVRNIILFVGLTVTLLGIVASIFIARKIIDPIHKLHKGTEIISKGNLDYRLDISTGDEIEQLAAAFNIMTGHLQERKRLEAQLRQAQKMEAIGTLAGGIAHDFNNMLNAIIGYSSLIQMDMKENDPRRAYLKEILDASERASHLTKGLLAFSRKQPMETKPVNINEIVTDFKKMIRRMIREDIELKIILNPPFPPLAKGGEGGFGDLTVTADTGQIEQILMNLATNARDAMPEGGILSIETGLIEINQEYINIHGYGKEGMYAIITVSDTGIGMDEMTRQRIFEPFFTTKGLGRGTGLGLAIVYGIVKQHNGYINCYTKLGEGTTFKICLPLIKKEVEVEEIELPPVRGGTETMLLAEDEDAVRRAIMTVLERYGYNVIEAVDGEDAVNKFMENKDRIQLLMLDVIMPKKGGKEAYDEIRKIKPDIKTIFASGYTADILNRKGMLEEGINFVFKPISPGGLLRKVREVLDR
jgi:signal transduction histidine kinase